MSKWERTLGCAITQSITQLPNYPFTKLTDVVIVGAGPAGSVAGAMLARAGARVRIVDRAAFPRDKLCGDTVNPGTLARLRALDLASGIDACSLRVDGMRVTGGGGVTIDGRYPGELSGRAITRRELDWL